MGPVTHHCLNTRKPLIPSCLQADLGYSVSQVVLMVKNLPTGDAEIWVRFLDWEDPLEKGIATQSSILAWRIPRTEDLEGYSQ